MERLVKGREIQLNVQDIIFVQEDSNTQTLQFKFTRADYEYDLSTLKAYVLYRPNGTKGVNFDKGVLTSDETVLTVAWTITRNVSFAEGKLEFQIVFTDTDDPVKNLSRKRWATKIVSVTIPKSLLGEPFVVPEEPIIAQLIELQENVEAAIGKSEEASKAADNAAKLATEAAGGIQLAVDAKDAAIAAKDAAVTAKTEAQKSAITANEDKIAAENAAKTATAKAGEAAVSASEAERCKIAAETSAVEADKSKTAAEGSAETAATRATESGGSAKAAKSSQDAAASSEQAASQKATEAAGSAEAAAASRAAAEKSAGTASTKATDAANSAKAAKESQDAAATSAGIATEKAAAAAISAETAGTAANTATTEAAKVKTWKPVITNGILTFIVDSDPTPPEGYNVIGPEGQSPTITIGANENWFVNGVDTGKPSRGAKGDTSILTIGANGNFFIDGEDTGQKAQGPTGPPGTDGKNGRDGVDGVSPEISISADGYWEINGAKTDKKAVPENGTHGKDGKAATIRIGTVSTGAPGTQAAVNNGGTETDAVLNITIPRGGDGANGKDGSNGKDGAPGAKGADGATWLFGNVAPTNQGKTGDFYINTTTYDVYSKATGAWVKTGNIKGATGPQGVPGTNGKDGAPGAKGADGKAATVSVGTVTTLQPGQPATVNNSGTENAAVLNFGIPQGQSGSGGTTGGCAAFKIKKGFIADADGGIFPLVNYVQNQSVATLAADGSIDLAGPGAYTFEFNSLLELESEPNTALEVVCSVTDENYTDFGDIPGSRVNGSQDASKFIYAFTGTTCYQVVASYLRVTFFLASGVKGTALQDGYLIINKISDQYPSS